MPLGTLGRSPPPFFKQGPSALSKLTVLSAVAIALMVVDARLSLVAPLRQGVAAVIYPLQWLVLQPVQGARLASAYFTSLRAAQQEKAQASEALARQAMRAAQVELLTLENQRLRDLLDMRQRLDTPAQGAEVLYDAGDPYTRKLVIDQGQTHGVRDGAPVLDGHGVLGQVTRAYPLSAEVTLLTDRSQAISVLNTRTGARSLAYGVPRGGAGGAMELRFTAPHADIEAGDLLSTSGVDGVYPAGLPVGKVTRIERETASAFAQVEVEPIANPISAQHVLVLKALPPLSAELVPPEAAAPATPARAGGSGGKGRPGQPDARHGTGGTP